MILWVGVPHSKSLPYHVWQPWVSGHRNSNFLVCPMKDSRSWYHMSARTTGGTYLKKLLTVRSKPVPGIGKKKKNGNCKAFCVTRKRSNDNCKAFRVTRKPNNQQSY